MIAVHILLALALLFVALSLMPAPNHHRHNTKGWNR